MIIRNYLLLTALLLGALLALPGCKPSQTATASGGGRGARDGHVDIATQPELAGKYIDAATFQARGENAQAITLYQEILAKFPHHPASEYNLALLLREGNRLTEALPHAEAAVKHNPDNLWAHILLADLYENTGKPENAAKALQDASRRFPEEVDVLMRLSEVYLKMGKPEEVLRLVDEIEHQTGEAEMAALQRKEIYMMLHRPEDAIATMKELIKKYPETKDYYYDLHDLYLTLGRMPEAIGVLEELYTHDPNDPTTLFRLVDYYQRNGKPDVAKKYLDHAFDSPSVPLDTKIRFLAQLMANEESDEDTERIETVIQALYKQAPENATLLSLMGDLYVKRAEPDSARPYFRKSLNKDQLNKALWEQLLSIDLETKQYDSLLTDVAEALVIFPNHLKFNYYQGVAYYQKGEAEKAIRPLEKTVKLSGSDYEFQAQALVMLGDAYAKAGKTDKAEETYRKALSLSPGNLMAMNNFSYFLANQGKGLDEAQRLIEKVIDRQPDNAAYQDTYGWVLYKLERYADARRWIEKAYAQQKGGDVAEHLGDVQFKLDNVDKAVELWQEAIRLGNASPSLRDKVARRAL